MPQQPTHGILSQGPERLGLPRLTDRWVMRRSGRSASGLLSGASQAQLVAFVRPGEVQPAPPGSASGFGELAAGDSEAGHTEPIGCLDGADELGIGSFSVAGPVSLPQGASEPVAGSGRERR